MHRSIHHHQSKEGLPNLRVTTRAECSGLSTSSPRRPQNPRRRACDRMKLILEDIIFCFSCFSDKEGDVTVGSGWLVQGARSANLLQTAHPSFSIQQHNLRRIVQTEAGELKAWASLRAFCLSEEPTNCLIVSGRSSATFIVGDVPTSAAENDMEDLIVLRLRKVLSVPVETFRFAKVTNCSDCTHVVSAVRGVLSMQDCHNVTLISRCWQQCTFRVATMWSCVYISTPRKPIMLGDNRGITLAPHNAVYPHLAAHLEQAELLDLLRIDGCFRLISCK